MREMERYQQEFYSTSMTGEIYGIPYGFWSTTFTVWANNSAGSNSTTITINVQEEAPDIAYAGSPFTFTKNSLVSGATPTNAGGAPDAWAIDPEISTSIPGLSFNTATGAITGTPTGIHSARTFTVWANNSADSNSTTISITVQDEAADISYAGSPFTFTKNSLVSGATPTNVGGAPDAWAIDPEISTTIPGLSFNTATGASPVRQQEYIQPLRSPFGRTIPQVIFRQPFRSPFKMKMLTFRTQVHRLRSPRTVL